MTSQPPVADTSVPWWYRAACRDQNPDLWVIPARVLTPDNCTALSICRGSCPVQTECLADARAKPPRGMVAGGVAWNVYGKPWARGRRAGHKPAPVGRRGSPLRDEAARAVDVAWRTLAAGGVLAHAATQAGLTESLVRRAAIVIRRDRDLAVRVWSGDEVLTRAYEMVMGYRTPDRVAS